MWLHQFLLIVLVKRMKRMRDLEKLSKQYPNAEFHIDDIR